MRWDYFTSFRFVFIWLWVELKINFVVVATVNYSFGCFVAWASHKCSVTHTCTQETDNCLHFIRNRPAYSVHRSHRISLRDDKVWNFITHAIAFAFIQNENENENVITSERELWKMRLKKMKNNVQNRGRDNNGIEMVATGSDAVKWWNFCCQILNRIFSYSSSFLNIYLFILFFVVNKLQFYWREKKRLGKISYNRNMFTFGQVFLSLVLLLFSFRYFSTRRKGTKRENEGKKCSNFTCFEK